MKPISLNLEIIIESELWNNPPVSSKFLETSALNALRLGSDDLTSPCEINLLLCDDAKIQSLNKSWREQDKPTNVLSFPAAYVSPDGNDFLGDIAIAYETVEKPNAISSSRSQKRIVKPSDENQSFFGIR